MLLVNFVVIDPATLRLEDLHAIRMKIRNRKGINGIQRMINLFSGRQKFVAHIAVTGKSSKIDQNFLVLPPIGVELYSNSAHNKAYTVPDFLEESRRKKRKFLPAYIPRSTKSASEIQVTSTPSKPVFIISTEEFKSATRKTGHHGSNNSKKRGKKNKYKTKQVWKCIQKFVDS